MTWPPPRSISANSCGLTWQVMSARTRPSDWNLTSNWRFGAPGAKGSPRCRLRAWMSSESILRCVGVQEAFSLNTAPISSRAFWLRPLAGALRPEKHARIMKAIRHLRRLLGRPQRRRQRRLPLPVRNERGEGGGEGHPTADARASRTKNDPPLPSPLLPRREEREKASALLSGFEAADPPVTTGRTDGRMK